MKLNFLIILTQVASVLASVASVNDNNFDSLVIQSDKWSLVDYYADWCRHCKLFEPIYEQLGELFADFDKVQILKINGDKDGRKTSKKYKIPGFPMIQMYHGNDEPIEFEGSRDLQSLSNFVQLLANIRLPLPEEEAEPSKVLELDDETFEEQVLKAPTAKSMVVFTALWCGHCVKVKPIWQKLANRIYGNDGEVIQLVEVVTTDVSAEKLMKQFGVQLFPTILYFDPSKVDSDGLRRPEAYVGERTVELFVQFINEKTGLHRSLDGRFDENAGRIAHLDNLIQHQVLGQDIASRIEFLKQIDNFVKISNSKVTERSEIVKPTDDLLMIPYYRKLTNKIINGEEEFIPREIKRLTKIITTNSRNIQEKTVDSMEKRLNVLKLFI